MADIWKPLETQVEGVSASTCGVGTPLLLVAGNGGRIAFWTAFAEQMKDEYQLIAIDYAQAPELQSDGSLTETALQKAEDIPKLLNSWGLDKIDLLGHSTGAIAVAACAAQNPEVIDRLIISGGWAAPHPYVEECMRLRSCILNELGGQEFLLDGLYRSLPPAYLFEQIASVGVDGLLGYRSALNPEIETARIDQIRTADMSPHLPKISAQTLVIHAKDDAVFPAQLGEHVASQIANARFELLDTGGHLAPMINAGPYCAVVKGFLEA